ncbi:MAG: hypothetical protein Q8O38_13500 [Sulfurimicrobium sp.]|nr:hypothetical protein [Sulfurimicrobium sp.]
MPLSSVTNLSYVSTALAQSRVAADRAQVISDQARLQRDQALLSLQQKQSQISQQNLAHQMVQTQTDRVAQKAQSVAPPQPVPAAVNTSGQTVGRVINVVA